VTDRDLCFVPATALQRLYRTRKASPLEVMPAVLTRIHAVNPRVNAYVTVARESALAAARKATAAFGRRTTLGPLHGVPVSIKDLTPTKGIRTTWGSKIFEHHVPAEDALYVERLKRAGAIVVGKTNTPEFGAGGGPIGPSYGCGKQRGKPRQTAAPDATQAQPGPHRPPCPLGSLPSQNLLVRSNGKLSWRGDKRAVSTSRPV